MMTTRVHRQAMGLLAFAFVFAPAVSVACTVSSTGVNFGSYDFLSSQDLEGTGDIIVTCDLSSSFTISLSTGASGSYALRTMQSGTHRLNYNLYTDRTRTIVWGDGTSGSVMVSGTGTNVTESVYGNVPAGQKPYVGTYSDIVVVTLTF